MGAFATAVQEFLCKQLATDHPDTDWRTEYPVNNTNVDIAGVDTASLYLIELEWRRADPADNAAKLFRHLHGAETDVERIVFFHIFTEYYSLESGGISSKRKNAEFVGQMAAEMIDELTYIPIEFGFEPPKRGAEWPDAWETQASAVAHTLSEHI